MSPYLEAPPLAFAHRGGALLPVNEGIENTLRAIENVVALGYRYIETDVQASADGEAFAFHDENLGRMAPDSEFGSRPFGELTAAQIRSVRTSGGEPVATIGEVLQAFPDTKFNIDVKSEAVIEPTVRAIEATGAIDRVLIASFSGKRLATVRRRLPGVATSAGPAEVAALRLGPRPFGRFASRGGAVCVQVPTTWRGRRLVTPGFIAAVHHRGMQVHVWTVDERAEMVDLLDMGVDGIVTDRPELLKEVLVERGRW